MTFLCYCLLFRMPRPYEYPDMAALLAADVSDLDEQNAALRLENLRLRMMVSETLEIAHQCLARLFAQTQAKS